MKRSEHTFTFSATQIAGAAAEEAAYHEQRQEYWEGELDASISRVRETAEVRVVELEATGGKRVDVRVHFGDAAAYARMNEAQGKIERHREAADRFRTDHRLYSSQAGTPPGANTVGIITPERFYDLDVEDVHHFRLGGQPRDE